MRPRVYAGLVTRAIAFAFDALIIDGVAPIVAGVTLLVLSVFPHATDQRQVLAVIGAVVLAIWTATFFVVFWTTTGQTPGDRLMRIRVGRVDGSALRPRHALLRLGGMVVSLPLFWGYWPILLSARRRGFFDKLAGTVVTVVPGLDPALDDRAVPVR